MNSLLTSFVFVCPTTKVSDGYFFCITLTDENWQRNHRSLLLSFFSLFRKKTRRFHTHLQWERFRPAVASSDYCVEDSERLIFGSETTFSGSVPSGWRNNRRCPAIYSSSGTKIFLARFLSSVEFTFRRRFNHRLNSSSLFRAMNSVFTRPSSTDNFRQ